MNQLRKGWQWVVSGMATLLIVATLGGLGTHYAFAQENQGARTPMMQGDKQERQNGANAQQDSQPGDNEAQGNQEGGNENDGFQNQSFQGREGGLGEGHSEGEGFLALIPIAIVGLLGLWVVRNWSNNNNRLIGMLRGASAKVQSTVTTVNHAPNVLEVVQLRYAKGEIQRDEFETLMSDLGGVVQPTSADA